MKKTETLKELNERWYYRLSKVAFVILYLLTIVFSVFFIVSRYSAQSDFVRENSKIICVGGNNKTLSYDKFVDKNNVLYYPKNLIDACDLRQGYHCKVNPDYNPNFWGDIMNGSHEIVGSSNKSICSYDVGYDQIISAGIEKTYKIEKVGGLPQIVLFSLSVIISISFCFEIIKRIFYYVVFGTFKPE